MTDPYKEIFSVFEQTSKRNSRYATMGIGAELGTITSRMELKLDNFKHPIRDYLVAEYLTLGNSFSRTSTEENHSHNVPTPSKMRALSPGDRVVVLLVNGGQEHVVVARVVSNA